MFAKENCTSHPPFLICNNEIFVTKYGLKCSVSCRYAVLLYVIVLAHFLASTSCKLPLMLCGADQYNKTCQYVDCIIVLHTNVWQPLWIYQKNKQIRIYRLFFT